MSKQLEMWIINVCRRTTMLVGTLVAVCMDVVREKDVIGWQRDAAPSRSQLSKPSWWCPWTMRRRCWIILSPPLSRGLPSAPRALPNAAADPSIEILMLLQEVEKPIDLLRCGNNRLYLIKSLYRLGRPARHCTARLHCTLPNLSLICPTDAENRRLLLRKLW